MIHDAISRNLADKGVNQVASGGDVIVAYLLIVRQQRRHGIHQHLLSGMAGMPPPCTTRLTMSTPGSNTPYYFRGRHAAGGHH